MINAELLEAIDKEFEQALRRNEKVKTLYSKIRDGTATFENAQDLAIEIGEELSAAFGEHIVPTELPNGRMTFAIGDEVVRPEIVKGYDYTSSYFNRVQEAYYKSKNLNINGAQPDLNEDRIKGFIDKLTSDEYENVKWLLEDPAYLVNYFESVVDTGIKNNVGMLGESGIRAQIIREVDAGACPWCMNLAGTYEYPVESDEVYHRHRDCHCRVTYTLPDGFRQNVWSKKTWTEESANQRSLFAQNYAKTITKLSPETAAELQNLILNQ